MRYSVTDAGQALTEACTQAEKSGAPKECLLGLMQRDFQLKNVTGIVISSLPRTIFDIVCEVQQKHCMAIDTL